MTTFKQLIGRVSGLLIEYCIFIGFKRATTTGLSVRLNGQQQFVPYQRPMGMLRSIPLLQPAKSTEIYGQRERGT